MIRYEETEFGFNWGAAEIERMCSNAIKEWVTFSVTTPKEDLQIYVTKTGKVRVYGKSGKEWKETAK